MESISFKSDQSQGNRLSIHLDAVGGISGDMFASAFLDLNPELMVAIKESVDEIGRLSSQGSSRRFVRMP